MKVRLIVGAQRLISRVAASLPGRGEPISWVVGVDEIATMLTSIAAAVPGSYSVCLGGHSFYSFGYDRELAMKGGRVRRALSAYLHAPWVFGRLLRRAAGFIYLGSAGFLDSSVDSRRFEFELLHQHGVRIVLFFLGDDIRAPRLMHELERATGRVNVSTHAAAIAPVFETDGYDRLKRSIAAVADDFADLVFSAPVDQSSYLKHEILPVTYFFPDGEVGVPKRRSLDERLVVLHAPSNPVIKGTDEVRRAVESLREEGFEFDYRELIGVPHDDVRASLREADIVLNQFYAFLPGVFGVEALAAGAAVMMSADENLEPVLPPGSNHAWIVTGHDEITRNLRELLLDRDLVAAYSRRGVEWVREYAVESRSGAWLRQRLNTLLEAPATTSGRGRVP